MDKGMHGPHPQERKPQISQELPRYNTYVHNSQDPTMLYYATT